MLFLRTAFLGPNDASDYTSRVSVPAVIFSKLSISFNPFSTTLPYPQITALTAILYKRETTTPPLWKKFISSFDRMLVDPPLPPIRHLLHLRATAFSHPLAKRTLAGEHRDLRTFSGRAAAPALSALRPSGYPQRIKILVNPDSETAPTAPLEEELDTASDYNSDESG
ncbi:hypothetical protein B0H11DRAFT_2269394 [Mycena galericulata]|nr:hypothetical protein B0H11DRAFT_2269394 [Mycena galericulata]